MADGSFVMPPEVYEATIDWPNRLAYEGPFYRQLFERVGVRRVLDNACGTGNHAALFHSWGLDVEGADISEAMIRHCRTRYGQPDGLRWVVRGFDQPAEPAASFDAVVCPGNSLALARDTDAVIRAVHRMVQAVRPGGAVVIHLLNLWHVPEGPTHWMKCQGLGEVAAGRIAIKGIHRCGPRGYADFIILNPVGPAGAEMAAESICFWGLEASDLRTMALQAGASRVECFGSFTQNPYERPVSQELVFVAIR